MDPTACVSFLTTFGPHDFINNPNRQKFRNCLYGCDICQDVCPMNKGKLEGKQEFPGLSDLVPALLPEEIINMEEAFFRETIQPKFYYLTPDDLWKLKINALCYMQNNYEEKYRACILGACESEDEKVREIARDIRARI